MDVQKARAFLAVAEELHFGRAAQRLHIAQPPLSRMIRALEAELGAELFERSPRHVALSEAGEALVEPARELVMLAQRIPEIVRRARDGETGRVRLGYSGASVNGIVSKLIRGVRTARPELSVELHGSQLSYAGMERVRAGTLDAVIGRWDYLPDDVDSRVIAHEDLLVALPDSHPLAAQDQISPALLRDESWVVLPGGSGATLSNRLYVLGRRGRFIPRIVRTAADSATQMLLVDAGAGLALTFAGVRENIPSPGVAFRPLSADLGHVDVRIVWSRARRSAALNTLIELSEEVFPSTAP